MIPEKTQIAASAFAENHEDDAMQLTGMHHLTAISAKPRENSVFTGLIGMRLLKAGLKCRRSSGRAELALGLSCHPVVSSTLWPIRVIASAAMPRLLRHGLLRRFAPRNDGD